MNLNKLIILSGFIMFLFSCKSKKDTYNYINENDAKAIEILKENSISTIQPGDKLMILVSAKDLDVVKPFNQNFNGSELLMDRSSTNSVMNNPQVVGPTYDVDENANITFPVLGLINTKNKSIEQFKYDLEVRLKEHIKNPIVNVRNSNFKITIIGEVEKEGQYLINDSKINILSALSLAYGISTFGLKEKVRVLRTVDGVVTRATLDLTNPDFINSPYYYLKQNDIIIVDTNKSKIKSRNYGPETTLYVSIASILASILVTVIAIIAR